MTGKWCKWCEKSIDSEEVIVIKPAMYNVTDDSFEYDEKQTIAVYHPNCWEEFIKHITV